jgi:hypothetical protein
MALGQLLAYFRTVDILSIKVTVTLKILLGETRRRYHETQVDSVKRFNQTLQLE